MNEQGSLFDENERQPSAVDPEYVMPPVVSYTPNPHFPTSSEGSTDSVADIPETQEVAANENGALPLLQDAVAAVGQANYRKSFARRLPDSEVSPSAHRRRLTVDQARRRAEVKAGDFTLEAKQKYEKTRDYVKAGLGFLSFLGADVSADRPVTFGEFVNNVSGPKNDGIRREVKRGYKGWKPKYTDLVVTDKPLVELESAGEAGEVTSMTRLATRIVNANEEAFTKEDVPDSLVYFEGLLKERGGAALSAVEDSVLVKNPEGYKQTIRGQAENGSRLTEQEYRDVISEKIIREQNIVADLEVKRLALDSVAVHFTGKVPQDYSEVAETLRTVVQMFDEQIGVLATYEKWDEDEVALRRQQLHDTLLTVNNDGDKRLPALKYLVEISSRYIDRKINLFRSNIKSLSN